MPVLTSGQDRPSEPVPAQLDTSTENSVSDIDEESQQASNTSVSLNGDLCRIENPPAPVTDPVKDDHKVDIVTDHVLEAALQEAVRAEADSHSQGASDMDIEDFYAPDPNQLAPDTSIEPTDEKRSPIYSPIFERSDAADGESDNYEPPEAPPQVDKPSIDSPPFSPAPPETISELTPNTTLANDTLQIIDQNGQIEAGELLPQQNGSVPLLCEVK
jgi:hypothetical protein